MHRRRPPPEPSSPTAGVGATVRGVKTLLLADVHSNFVALEAVLEATAGERFDAVLFAGDLVDYGTDPRPCVEWARAAVTAGVRGNHDHAVAQRIAARGGSGFKALAAATRPLHWDVLSPRTLKFLGRLPVTRYFRNEEATFFLVHGTPRDPMDEYLGEDAAAWQDRLTDVQADFVVCGHTHRAMVLEVGDTRVINPGSVGQPRDGKRGAAFAVVEDDRVHLRRVGYDIGTAIDQVLRAAAPTWVAELTEALLRTGGELSRDEIDAFVPADADPGSA